MDFSGDRLRVVLRHVVAVEQYAVNIAEAHKLGFGPGGHTDVLRVEFQRKAQKVWKKTLPPLFLRQVADSYERCAWLMESVLPDESVGGDWANIARYLDAVATAIDEDPDCTEQEMMMESPDIEYMPEVIHYERLAELMHPDAVEGLRAAAAAVAQICRSNSSITPNKVQLVCLQGLANGEKQASLAKRLGYSERHIQRIIADMWHQFGVDNTTQAVAFAVAQCWVTVPQNMR